MKKILILTHNDFIGHLVTQVLEKEGATCCRVRNPQQATERLQKEHFDVLFFQATVENSETFIQLIKQNHPKLPILTTCFFNHRQINTLERLTSFTPFTIPFSNELLKEQIAHLVV